MNFWSCLAKTAGVSWQRRKQDLNYMRGKEQLVYRPAQSSGLHRHIHGGGILDGSAGTRDSLQTWETNDSENFHKAEAVNANMNMRDMHGSFSPRSW